MDFKPQVDLLYRPEVICYKRFLTVPSHKVLVFIDRRRLVSIPSHIFPGYFFADYVDAYA